MQKWFDNNNRIISVGSETKIYNRYNELIAIAIWKHNLLKMRSIIINDRTAQTN